MSINRFFPEIGIFRVFSLFIINLAGRHYARIKLIEQRSLDVREGGSVKEPQGAHSTRARSAAKTTSMYIKGTIRRYSL
jgi:hypothetical protein